jgi:hypothetical protein
MLLAHPTRFERVTFAFGGQRLRAPATIDPVGEMTLRRIEPGGIDLPKIGDSGLRTTLDRHHLLGIEPVVDPIGPMLDQLRARVD